MAPLHPISQPNYRPDIDGLRAVAILIVVAFHAFPSVVKGGFVGVDVFFVISGFLISSIVFKGLERGDFSFKTFYSHRIKRIFPALILVLATSFTVGWFILFPNEFSQLGKHIAAGSGFLQNIVLWKESGYFDVASDSKPLMHLWSLAIEEQFYLAYPVVIFLAWRVGVNFLTVVLFFLTSSFLLNIYKIYSDSVAAFFLPHFRIWELLVGALLAYIQVSKNSFISKKIEFLIREDAIKNILSCAGLLLLIIAILFIDKSKVFPGWWALLPVLGTFLLILSGPGASVNKLILSNKIMVFVGLISYPLYLWHWPILSFMRLWWSGIPSISARMAAIAASFLLAWMTYRFVEKPIRGGKKSNAVTLSLFAILVVVGSIGFSSFERNGFDFRGVAQNKKGIYEGLGWDGFWSNATCFDKFQISPCVENSEEPNAILIGDSHANHLYPGLADIDGLFLINIGTCSPLEGVSVKLSAGSPPHECLVREHLERNFTAVKNSKTLKVAIVSAWWSPVLSGGYQNKSQSAFQLESKYKNESNFSNPELVRAGLERTIDRLQEEGLDIIFVRDTPVIGSNLLEYCKLRSPLMAKNCTTSKSDFIQHRQLEDSLLDYLRIKYPDLKVVDPIDKFCNDSQCFIMKNGVLFYRDDNHLSVEGSKLLATEIQKFLVKPERRLLASIQNSK